MIDLVRWPTHVSDCKALYFKRLVDDGDGRFVLESDSGKTYEVLLGEYCGPYVVVDEEFLTKYWTIKPNDLGWTFIVVNSDLVRFFPGVMESVNYKHYVVSTMDTCLELLSEKEPIIRVATI